MYVQCHKMAHSRNYCCHGKINYTFPFYCCWCGYSFQQYKDVQCCHGIATVGYLGIVVELQNTGLLKMIVGVITNRLATPFSRCNPMWFSFCGVTSRIRFMFLLFPQVSRNWRYEPEPPLKPSPLTCYRQFGTNWIIVLMSVESQRVHIQGTY